MSDNILIKPVIVIKLRKYRGEETEPYEEIILRSAEVAEDTENGTN